MRRGRDREPTDFVALGVATTMACKSLLSRYEREVGDDELVRTVVASEYVDGPFWKQRKSELLFLTAAFLRTLLPRTPWRVYGMTAAPRADLLWRSRRTLMGDLLAVRRIGIQSREPFVTQALTALASDSCGDGAPLAFVRVCVVPNPRLSFAVAADGTIHEATASPLFAFEDAP